MIFRSVEDADEYLADFDMRKAFFRSLMTALHEVPGGVPKIQRHLSPGFPRSRWGILILRNLQAFSQLDQYSRGIDRGADAGHMSGISWSVRRDARMEWFQSGMCGNCGGNHRAKYCRRNFGRTPTPSEVEFEDLPVVADIPPPPAIHVDDRLRSRQRERREGGEDRERRPARAGVEEFRSAFWH